MSKEILRNYLEINEVELYDAYLCPVGIITIEVGFNLEGSDVNYE